MTAAVVDMAVYLEGSVAKPSVAPWTLGPWLPPYHVCIALTPMVMEEDSTNSVNRLSRGACAHVLLEYSPTRTHTRTRE